MYDEQSNDGVYDEQCNFDMYDNANPVLVCEDKRFNHVDCHNTNDTEWVADMKVNDQPLQLEVDTGARCNIMSLNTVKRLGLECYSKKQCSH